MKTNPILSGQKVSKLFYTILGTALAFTAFQGCIPMTYSTGVAVQTNTEVYRPDWAPVYDNTDQARYYYLPDIEAYYDLRAREYVCLEDGNWVFTAVLPYASFDLNNAFVVVLDNQVSQPWRQHHLYVSHYPRYYYRSVYNSPTHAYTYHDMRGFNENGKRDIFRNNYSQSQNQRQTQNQQYQRINNRSTSTGRQVSVPTTQDNNNRTSQQNVRTSNQTQTNRSTQPQNISTSNQQQNNNGAASQQSSRSQSATEQSRQPINTTGNRTTIPTSGTNTQSNQRTNINQQNVQTQASQSRTQPAEYKGRSIGQPVRVQRDMRIQKETQTKNNNSRESNSNQESNNRRR